MNHIENPLEYARAVKSAIEMAREVWGDKLTPEELGVTACIFVGNFNPKLSPDPSENPGNLRKYPAHGVDGRSYMAVWGSIVSRGKRPDETVILRDKLDEAFNNCGSM